MICNLSRFFLVGTLFFLVSRRSSAEKQCWSSSWTNHKIVLKLILSKTLSLQIISVKTNYALQKIITEQNFNTKWWKLLQKVSSTEFWHMSKSKYSWYMRQNVTQTFLLYAKLFLLLFEVKFLSQGKIRH